MKRTTVSLAKRIEKLEESIAPAVRHITLTYNKEVDGRLDGAIQRAAEAVGIGEVRENDVIYVIEVFDSKE